MRLVVPLVLAAAILRAPAASAYPTQPADRSDSGHFSLTVISRNAPALELYSYLTPSSDPSSAGSSSRLSSGDDLKSLLALRFYPPGGNQGFLLPSAGAPVVRSTVDMLGGNPPLQAAFTTYDPRDLAPYGLFSGYFEAFSFRASPRQRMIGDDRGGLMATTRARPAQSPFSFSVYQIDTAHLSSNYQVNFDLYSEKVRSTDDTEIVPEVIVGPFKEQAPPVRR